MDTQPGEIWKDLMGWETFYKISSFGRIYSIPHPRCEHCGYEGRKGRMIKEGGCKSGPKRYHATSLSKPGLNGQRSFTVHRLVAKHFLPPPEDPAKIWVNHKDGNKYNNHV